MPAAMQANGLAPDEPGRRTVEVEVSDAQSGDANYWNGARQSNGFKADRAGGITPLEVDLHRLGLIPRRDQIEQPVAVDIRRRDALRTGCVLATRINLYRLEEAGGASRRQKVDGAAASADWGRAVLASTADKSARRRQSEHCKRREQPADSMKR